MRRNFTEAQEVRSRFIPGKLVMRNIRKACFKLVSSRIQAWSAPGPNRPRNICKSPGGSSWLGIQAWESCALPGVRNICAGGLQEGGRLAALLVNHVGQRCKLRKFIVGFPVQ